MKLFRLAPEWLRGRTQPTSTSAADGWMEAMIGVRHTMSSEDNDENKNYWRFYVLAFVTCLVFLLFAVRMLSIYLFSGDAYVLQAEGNRFREIIEYAPRGQIIDVNGVALAYNDVSSQLVVTPYLLTSDTQRRSSEYKQVASIINWKPKQIEDVIAEVGEDYVLPISIKKSLSRQESLKLKGVLSQDSAFSVASVPQRTYVANAGLEHLVGYVGPVNPQELLRDPSGTLLPTDVIGKTGLEASYDEYLRGRNGVQRVEVDALGRPVRVVARQPAIPGRDLYTTIDIETQKGLYAALKKQTKLAESTKASGVALHPMNGSIIAMVSIPGFDANKFVDGIEDRLYERLVQSPDQPLFNKAISGGYTSGSVIKPIVAAAALEEGVVDESTIIVDRGYIDIAGAFGGSFRFRGWRPEGLGPMNVRSAIAWSSNIYFYTVAGGHNGLAGLGEPRLTRYYRAFGLGEPTGIRLPGETSGRVPDDAWKRSYKGEQWYVGDTYNIAIGQGDLLISPLQIAIATAAVINDGILLYPTVEQQSEPQVKRSIDVSSENFQIVREGMRQVLTAGTTCECTFMKIPHQVAGKSGTAETNTPDGKAPHAWFNAYAPYDEPEILVSILIEEGQGGSAFAAPAAAQALEAYFDR